MKTTNLFFVLIFCSFQSFSQDIIGKWQGLLKIQGTELTVVFNISSKADGYSATMDSPDQGAFDLPVQEVTFEDNHLELKMMTPLISYSGDLNEEGIIEGTFSQAGYDFPLNMSKDEVKKKEKRRPQEPKEPYPYQSENVKFTNTVDDIQLAGTLTLPTTGKSFAAVVLISGSGPQNRDEELLGHKPFLILSDYLTQKGIAVLRFDDRGVGESQGEFATATTEDFVKDVDAAVQYLKSRKDIKSNRIGLIGHSEGGIIAPKLAAESNDVNFIVLMAGTGIRGDKLLLEQSQLIGRAGGLSEEELKMARTFNKGAYEIVVNSVDQEQVKKDLKVYLEESVAKNPELASGNGLKEEVFVNQMMGQLTSPWIQYFLKYDPAEALKKVDCPVLAIIGEKDLQVPADLNLKAIEQALKAGGNDQYTLMKLEELNHLFQKADTGSPSEYAQIEETISPKALEVMNQWIQEQIK